MHDSKKKQVTSVIIYCRYTIIPDSGGIHSRSFSNVPVTLKKMKSEEVKNEHRLCLCMRACVIDEDITWRIKADRRL